MSTTTAGMPVRDPGAAAQPGATARVLVIEDETTLLAALRFNLENAGYEPLLATDGEAGLEIARREMPDLIILDLMLPGMEGLEVCKLLRKESAIPVIMLTAKTEEVDRIVGLEIGADDYVTKPFSMKELISRVKAHLRRRSLNSQTARAEVLESGDLRIDLLQREARREGMALWLRPKEFDLLAFLVRNRNLVFSREQLLQNIWGYEYPGETRTVDVHIGRLRAHIDDRSKPSRIMSVRGIGYRFTG